jgi:endonuclease-3
MRDYNWGELLKLMEEEGRKRHAPVLTLKNFLNDPFKHLVFAILSARTRDEQTVKAVQNLFNVVRSPEDLSGLDLDDIEELIRSVGFYRNKARNLKLMAEHLIENHNSKVPDSFEDLVKLPGVGRKVANVVLSYAFNKDTIAVDTHVHRISNRMGIVATKTPEQTELELKKKVPEKYWKRLNRSMVAFGQTVCKPVKPLCSECPVFEYCEQKGV